MAWNGLRTRSREFTFISDKVPIALNHRFRILGKVARKFYGDTRFERILYSILGFMILLALLVTIEHYFYKNYRIPAELVWQKVKQEAAIYDLEPEFVFAIVFAESSFRPRASNTGGNGIMQVSPATWGDMTNHPYDMVWDWRLNIEVGTAYLGWCREYLESKKRFSYPLLAACYNKGPDYVRRNNFDIKKVGKTTNLTYQQLFLGNLDPVKR